MRRSTTATPQLLVVDVGNSRLRAGRFDATHLAEEWSCAYDSVHPRWSAAWRQLLRQIVERHGTMPAQIASVARPRSVVARKALLDLGFTPAHLVTHRDTWPFEIDIDAPQTLGVDRLANVAGAVSLGLHSAVVVDLGTAITVDVLDAGVFRGGLIMPGLSLQARALHEYTSHLPLVDVQQEAPLLGRNTQDAWLAGMTQMTLAGLAATARRLARSLGHGTPILCTGGWARRLRPFLRSVRHEPHLLFLGLRERARSCR